MARKKTFKPLEYYYVKGTKCSEPIINYKEYFKDHGIDAVNAIFFGRCNMVGQELDNGIIVTEEMNKVVTKFLFDPLIPLECSLRKRNDYACNIVDKYEELRFAEIDEKDKLKKHEVPLNLKEWDTQIRQELIADLAETWCWGEDEEKIKEFRWYNMHWGELPTPVRIPSWMFFTHTYLDHPLSCLSMAEMVALAHIMYFSKPSCSTGYIECSGHIERWCNCTVNDAHDACMSLYFRGLVDFRFLPSVLVYGLNRNLGWKANTVYIQQLLDVMGRRIDV